MVIVSFISLLSAVISILAIIISISIFNKVFQENYKRPWLFIGISSIFIALSQLLNFASGFYGIKIVNSTITEATIYLLDFISISVLTYGLLLEFLILKFYKGKFVKMKFVPVQEGMLGGELDINVSNGNSYVAIKKDKNFIFEQFSEATKKGFEGFLITEDNPKEIRVKYNILRTPVAWISQIDNSVNSSYLKDSLDENSDIVDPLQLNNLITYIDNFLEQSQNPYVQIDLNLILKINNTAIVFEFLKYISARVKRYNGILICLINTDILEKSYIVELETFLKKLE